jgi:prevent-host-death family protein
MRRTTITEAKNGLSALIDRVRSGETILITDRGLAVARIEPIASHADQTDRIARLERAGILRRGLAPTGAALIRRPGPKVRSGSSASQALLDERRGGR